MSQIVWPFRYKVYYVFVCMLGLASFALSIYSIVLGHAFTGFFSIALLMVLFYGLIEVGLSDRDDLRPVIQKELMDEYLLDTPVQLDGRSYIAHIQVFPSRLVIEPTREWKDGYPVHIVYWDRSELLVPDDTKILIKTSSHCYTLTLSNNSVREKLIMYHEAFQK